MLESKHLSEAYAEGTWTENARRSRQTYERLEDALSWLGAHFEEQPTLTQIAAQAGLSDFHFQRLFSRWVGLSPKKYVQYLTLQRAKALLEGSRTVMDTAYAVGLSGSSRLHDLFVSIEALTPGEYRRRGAGVKIHYGFHDCAFGDCVVLQTQRGVCGLAFVGDKDREQALAALTRGWEQAELEHDPSSTAATVRRIFSAHSDSDSLQDEPIRLWLRGTGFQIKVWEALLKIPSGALTSYKDLADRIDCPHSARAVGNAVGANPIAYLIPCHRVIHRSGMIGGYRWGVGRKLAMLSRELSF